MAYPRRSVPAIPEIESVEICRFIKLQWDLWLFWPLSKRDAVKAISNGQKMISFPQAMPVNMDKLA